MGDPVMYKKESLALRTANNNGETLTQDNLNTRILIESNLCHEVGITVLNILSLFIVHHKVGNGELFKISYLSNSYTF